MNKIKNNFIGRLMESSSSSNHKENNDTCTNILKGKLNDLF